MEKILEDLYYGKIRPFETHPPIIAKRRTEIFAKEKEFEKSLNEIQKKQYSDLMDNYMELFSLEFEHEFINGMKLGAKMMCGIFSDT